MRLTACLTRFESEWLALRSLLEQLPTAVLTRQSPAELLRSLGHLDPDLFLVDTRFSRDELAACLEMAGANATVLLVSPADAPDLAPFEDLDEVYDRFSIADPPAKQRRILLRALERSALLRRETRLAPAPAPLPPVRTVSDPSWELSLRALSRVLGAGDEPGSVVEPFLDLVAELAGVARCVLLSRAPGGASYSLASARGLQGPLLESSSFPAGAGIVGLLRREGRPIRREELHALPVGPEILRAFEALQAVVCIPLVTRAELPAILALGARLDGSSPAEDQIELLFSIGSQVAEAMERAARNEQMLLRGRRSHGALESMNAGVAAIDESGKVTLLNTRATEILGIAGPGLVGSDHRVLPAPLGDLLFGALHSGESTPRARLALPGSGAPLEVRSYPILVGDSPRPAGGVLVLEDISEQLALEESRRHADQQDVLDRLISQLAHEIKNPMVAVKTFAELFPGNLQDPDFAAFVQSTVIPEIGRLEETVGKLTDYVDPIRVDMGQVDLGALLETLLAQFRPVAGQAGVSIHLVLRGDLAPILGDRILLLKALSYCLGHLLLAVAGRDGAVVEVRAGADSGAASGVVIEMSSSHQWIHPEDLDRLFDPLYLSNDRLNLGLPAALRIVHEHRGVLAAVILPGEQVALRITLPVST